MNGNPAYTRLGYKVFDRLREEVEPLLMQALRETRPFEVGLYFHDPATHGFLNAVLPQSGALLNTHLDHRRLNVFALDDDQLTLLRRQIETSLRWGAKYGITHLSAFALPRRAQYQEALEKKLLEQLRILNRVCREYRFPIHIENTYHEIDLYQRLFTTLSREQLDQLHFCFDFGHAKVWSIRPLRAWLDLLVELEQGGRQLHFHLHTNRGLSDEHLSFVEAEWMGFCATDEYTAPWTSFEALAEIERRFPHAHKVMEVQASEARENLQRVIEVMEHLSLRDASISA
jgi:sugar phosphate isomerase/epimerase